MKRIASLIIKHWRGELSYAEQAELDQWAQQSPSNQQLLNQLTNDETLRKELLDYYEAEEAKDIVWKKIERATSENDITPIMPVVVSRSRGMKYRFAIAAVTIATLITAGVYLTTRRPGKPAVTAVAKTPDQVLPGGNKAVLTLANGKKIVLDDVANGQLAQEGNSVINKSDGTLQYTGSDNTEHQTRIAKLNTLATPKGGQFTLVLPDKSVVYLNAASSITYPTAFIGADRIVEITGEAYFEVAKNAAKPFKVHFNSKDREGEVVVLGTHFNINAYDDETAVKTTLLEGSVKVTATQPQATNNEPQTILKPGEQVSVLSLSKDQPSNLSHPIPIETEEVVAWKNGEFLFRKADVETILKQAARWYDLEIEYPNGKPKDLFTGGVARNVNLSRFLTILEMNEVKCKLEGKKLIVYK